MLIVSHDRELLTRVDQIAELSGGRARLYGGNLDAFEELRAEEQAAAQRAVSAAAADVRQQQRDLADSQVKLARRERYGKKMYATKREPKMIMQTRKREAQVSAARLRGLHEERLEAAQDRLAEAEQAVRDDAEIRVDLPDTRVPAGRTVLTMTGLAGMAWHPGRTSGGDGPAPPGPGAGGVLDTLIVRGPERIALTGPNGAGKTTLLRAIAGQAELPGVTVQRAAAGTGYLPQRLDVLDGRPVCWTTCAPPPRRRRSTRSGPGWPGSCSAANGPGSWPGHCPGGSGSAPRRPRCCWPSHHRSCCCSTSRPTTSTWPRPGSWPRPWTATAAR